MEAVNKLRIPSEIAEEVKNNSEFIWFFAGNSYEEILYIIPNYKKINSEELVSKLKDFVETLPQFILQKFILQSLSINNIIVITNTSFDTFCINDFVVEKYSENNISLNIEIEDDFHFLSINKNDLVTC